jgi:hypothetical protein
MTLRSRVTSRLSYAAGLRRFAALLSVNPDLSLPDYAEQTFPVESKAEADQIAEAFGARTLWRNGYYMAEAEFGGLRWEIRFAPPITEQDAA